MSTATLLVLITAFAGLVWCIGTVAVLTLDHQLRTDRIRLEASMCDADREATEAADMRRHQRERETHRLEVQEWLRMHREITGRDEPWKGS